MLVGTQKAHMVARLGVLRLAASRLAYIQPTLLVSIGGATIAPTLIRVAGFSIRDELDGTPNTATLRVDGFVPVKGNEIKIYLGDRATSRLIFAGHILEVTQVYDLIPAHLAYDLSCISYEWLLNRRTVTARYLTTSASVIAADLLARFTSGFSGAGIAAGLETLDEITFTNEDMTDCLDRLVDRIGGNWLIDYAKVLHLGLDIRPGETAVHPITDADPHGLIVIAIATDLSQVKTRVLVEGNGSQANAELPPGDTQMPVIDPVYFNPAGGTVTSGPQRITYTGVAQGGTGALIGTNPTPTNAPALAGLIAASGLETGGHAYAVTFYDGTGETTPGPSSAITMGGVIPAPAAAPTPTKQLAGTLSAGAYQWKVTFGTATGQETDAGSSASAVVTMDSIAAPSTVPTISLGTPPAGSGEVNLNANQDYSIRITFEQSGVPSVHTTGSPTSSTVHTPPDGTIPEPALRITRSTIPTPPPGYDVAYYGRYPSDGQYYRMATVADATYLYFMGNWAVAGMPNPAGLLPTTDTTAYRKAQLTNLPISPDGNVTKRHVYRTSAGGSDFKLAFTQNDNVTTSAEDNVADAARTATLPGTNTAILRQVAVSSIPIGPAGTTGRKLYRSTAGTSTPLKLLTTLANNTATTHTDSAADASLGATAPSTNTSSLTAATGTVTAGATSMPITSAAPFAATGGGWAQAGGALFRYTGVTSTTLIGIPAAGAAGALDTTLNYGTAILALPALTGIPASGAGSIAVAIARGDEVQLLVTRDDLAAQTLMASLVGGDGIHEDFIQDRRLSETEAINRGDARLAEVKDPVVRVTYATRDQTTRSGWDVSIDLSAPDVSGEFRIQRVTLTDFDARMITPPLRQVEASSRRFSFEALLRLIKGV